jgi:CRP-like cAMP-binding protein
MPAFIQVAVRNHLLATLAPEDLSLLQPSLEPVTLPEHSRLVKPNTPIEYAYFVEQGIISVVATTSKDCHIQVGLIGREGMVGAPILLGTDRMPYESVVQMPSTALRIRADDLRRAMAVSVPIHQHLSRFAHVLTIQAQQAALSNGCHHIEQRLARWLLMCHDRMDGDALSATQTSISNMLSVQRQSVIRILRSLEEKGAIFGKSGQITVLDRARLEGVAGDSYGVPEAEYARLFGLPPRPFQHLNKGSTKPRIALAISTLATLAGL